VIKWSDYHKEDNDDELLWGSLEHIVDAALAVAILVRMIKNPKQTVQWINDVTHDMKDILDEAAGGHRIMTPEQAVALATMRPYAPAADIIASLKNSGYSIVKVTVNRLSRND
jgi:hypothetical protein